MTRMARCTYFKTCGHEAPSDSPHLAFFQDKSDPAKLLSCAAPGTNAKGQCGYYEQAHRYDATRVRPEPRVAHEFVPATEGDPYDEYYSGCRGWD